jgi:hypothetical protein
MMRCKVVVLCVIGMIPLACSDQGSVTTYTGNQISDYAASWDGYAEAYTFEDGSDRIRLRIAADGQGSIQVGDTGLLPHPVDPAAAPWHWLAGNALVTRLKPGFLYPIYDPRVETARIRLGANFRDLYRDWCATQTPYLRDDSDPPLYECVHGNGNLVPSNDGSSCTATDGLGQPLPIDCVTVLACLNPPPCDPTFAACDDSGLLCPCDASSCSVPTVTDGQYPIKIDAALEDDGSKLIGTLAASDGTRYTVRLKRQ